VSLADAVESFGRGDWGALASAVADIIRRALRSVEEAYAAAIDAITTGFAMIIDDVKDIGLLDRLHHWIIGLVILFVGVIALILIFLLT
jgi:hypothetical protein